MYISAVIITVISNTLYHLFQKVTPSEVNPVVSLVITYLVAAVASLALLPFFPLSGTLKESIKQVNWASLAVGGTIIGIELGFLLAYRAGWNISLASLVSNTSVALLLVPVGLLLFNEKLPPVKAVGVVFALVGLVLVNWR
jgi:drug/metabolite transporter (DMT)-like permease